MLMIIVMLRYDENMNNVFQSAAFRVVSCSRAPCAVFVLPRTNSNECGLQQREAGSLVRHGGAGRKAGKYVTCRISMCPPKLNIDAMFLPQTSLVVDETCSAVHATSSHREVAPRCGACWVDMKMPVADTAG